MSAASIFVAAVLSDWLWPVMAVAIGGIIWLAVQRRADFSITATQSDVRIRGRLPPSKHGVVREFFRRDLDVQGTVKVRARRTGPGRYKFFLRGRLTPWQRQRIRNFLLAELP